MHRMVGAVIDQWTISKFIVDFSLIVTEGVNLFTAQFFFNTFNAVTKMCSPIFLIWSYLPTKTLKLFYIDRTMQWSANQLNFTLRLSQDLKCCISKKKHEFRPGLPNRGPRSCFVWPARSFWAMDFLMERLPQKMHTFSGK